MWPLEFLQEIDTPNCKNALNISIAFPAADNMTLLLPDPSISYQWKPALSKIYVTSKWPLKQAQCNGLGFNYLVEPIAICLFSGLTSMYGCPAPLDNRSFTILEWPIQHAQIRAVHFFLVFSKINEQFTLIIDIGLFFQTFFDFFILIFLRWCD